MPLRKELLNICQKIQDEKDGNKLQQLLTELGRVLSEEEEVLKREKATSHGTGHRDAEGKE